MPDTISRRILLVEDNEDSACLLAETLGERGHSVQVAHDGQSALVMARAGDLDIVVLDIGLPDMDGYELVRQMRELPHLREGVRFVALTGYSGAEHRERARAAGFDTQLTKPIFPDALMKVVQGAG